MSTSTPWEPPLAGAEPEQLIGALERMRWTFRWKADGLDEHGLAQRLGSSELSIGWLLRHLAEIEEDSWYKASGEAPAASESAEPESAYDRYDRSVVLARERVAARLADGGLDQPAALSEVIGQPVSLRRVLCDHLEEYARHVGHIDLLREAIDGRAGEDPPEGWRAESGSVATAFGDQA